MKDAQTRIPLFCAKSATGNIDLLTPIQRVLDSHWYVLGNEVQNFESEFSRYIGVAHCTSVANGTDALELALRALGVSQGDSVVTVANAGFYSSTAIRLIGAEPRYVDADAATLTLCPRALDAALVARPKAIIVTHLYGRVADMPGIMAVADAAGIPVIEDCAQAHGAVLDGRKAGSFGALGCFSFYPTKNLGALGDGGAIVTNDPELDTKLRRLRQYGWGAKYHVERDGGCNSRLDEMQAAILRAKLPHLDAQNEQRRDIARRYNEAFKDLPLRCPDTLAAEYVAHLYVVRCKERDALRAFLNDHGVATEIHYPVPDHHQTVASERDHSALPTTELLAQEALTLPCFPGLSDDGVSHVIATVRDFFGR